MQEDAYPDGLWEEDGWFYFSCKSCGCKTRYEGDDPMEFRYDAYAVCGGSQWCLP